MTDLEKNLDNNLKRLAEAQERANSYRLSFWRGVISGFGVVVGSTLLVALLIYVLSLFNTVPVIGNFIARIVEIVQKK